MRSSSFKCSPFLHSVLLLGIVGTLSSAAIGQQLTKITVHKILVLNPASSANQVDTSRLDSSRQKLHKALGSLESALRRGNQTELTTLRQQLRLTELAAAITNNPPDMAKLQALSHSLYGASSALERPGVVQLRDALAEFIQSARLAQVKNMPATYQWHFEKLTTQLTSNPTSRDEDILRRHVAWMHWLNETPEIAKQTSRKAAYPNFVVVVRKDLLKPYLDSLHRKVRETKFASHVIVGANVSGKVHADGTIWPELDFKSPLPKLRLHYTGTSHSPNSQAVSGPVIVRNKGVTAIKANTDIHWDGLRLIASPTVAQCTTKITQLGLSVHRARAIPMLSGRLVDRMVEGVAHRRASEQRAQAEHESSELTRRNVTARMDARVAEIIATANAKIDEYFAKPALRAGIHPALKLSMDKDCVSIGLTQPDAAKMAADTPPTWEPMEGGAILCLHQSALTGFTHKLCGGAVFQDNDFSDLQRQVMGTRSAEMKIGDQPRWALQLDYLQPYSAKIDTDGVQITIRAQSITYNGKTLTCPIRITAKYALQPSGTTLNCLRQGDVEVACLAGAEGSDAVRQKVAQFLKSKFSGFFQEHVYLDGITIPTGEKWDSMTTFFVREVQTKAGWLCVSIQSKGSDVTRLVNQKLKGSAVE